MANDNYLLSVICYNVTIFEWRLPDRKYLEMQEGRRFVTVRNQEQEYGFDLAKGMLCSLKKSGREMLMRPSDLVIWKSTMTREYHSMKGESRDKGRRIILYEGRIALL